MSKETETELTFLAAHIPEEAMSVQQIELVDVFIPEGIGAPLLRLRKKADNYEITKKTPLGEDKSIHSEETIELSKEEFAALEKASDRRVSKKRFFVNIGGYDAEVDVFTGALRGLVLIEFEFKSQKEIKEFVKPNCCLVDVTQEDEVYGGNLAGMSYSEIEGWLRKFNYKKIL